MGIWSWVCNTVQAVWGGLTAPVATAIGTLGLLVATVVLSVVTYGLKQETRLSREEEQWWRDRDGYIRGIEPFLGSYAERGDMRQVREGEWVGHEGALLDVNWYGVAFRDRYLGTYVGGHVTVHENSLEFTMGGRGRNEGHKRLRIRLTKGERWKMTQMAHARGHDILPPSSEYRLLVEALGSNPWTVREGGIDRIAEGGWRKGTMVNESYVPSADHWTLHGSSHIVWDGRERKPQIGLAGGMVVQGEDGSWEWIAQVTNTGTGPGSATVIMKREGEIVAEAIAPQVDAVHHGWNGGISIRNAQGKIRGKVDRGVLAGGDKVEMCLPEQGPGCLEVQVETTNPKGIKIDRATILVERGNAGQSRRIGGEVTVTHKGTRRTGKVYIVASRTNGARVCMFPGPIDMEPGETRTLHYVGAWHEPSNLKAEERVDLGTTVDIGAFRLSTIPGGEIVWGETLTMEVSVAKEIPLRWSIEQQEQSDDLREQQKSR